MVFGHTAQDVLLGSSASDALFGGDDEDTLRGLDGDDFLAGEQGSNHLYGGEGSDVFDFNSDKAENYTFDIIYDFSTQDGDILNLSSVVKDLNLYGSTFSGDKIQNLAKHVRFSAWPDYLDILVSQNGLSGDYFPIVRLMNNPDFQSNNASLIEMIQEGIITIGENNE